MGILGNVGGIVSSIVNYATNERNNRMQRDIHLQDQAWAAQQAAQANEWSIAQWNRENAYSSPAAQMKRLQDAGINPALAYSDGLFNQAATSPDVKVPQNGQRANTMPWQLDPMMMSNLETAFAQRELLKSQADEASANAELARSRVPLSQQEIENLKQQIKESEQNINESLERVGLIYQQASTEKEKRENLIKDREMLDKNYKLAEREINAKITLWSSEYEVNQKQALLIQKEAEKVGREIFELKETWDKRKLGIESDADFKYKESRLKDVDLEAYGIFFNPETGTYQVDFTKATKFDIENKEGILWARVISEILGNMFGIALGFSTKKVKT